MSQPEKPKTKRVSIEDVDVIAYQKVKDILRDLPEEARRLVLEWVNRAFPQDKE